MFIKITSVISGSECQHKYYSDCHQKQQATDEIDMKWAQEAGLFKNHRWMYNIRVGETLVLHTDIAEKLPEISDGNFTYEVVLPKYMNQTLYSDTNAFEVIEWITSKRAKIRELKPVFNEGEYHESTDRFEPDPDAEILEVRMRKNGCFYQPKQKCCPYVPTEHPHYHYDLSF